MSQSLQKTKRRIVSIEGTRKLTGAMELIASSELRKLSSRVEHSRAYLEEFGKCLGKAKSAIKAPKKAEEEAKENPPRLVLALFSDMGLCGAYNAEISAFMNEYMKKGNMLLCLGARSRTFDGKDIYEAPDFLPSLNAKSEGGEIAAFSKAVYEAFVFKRIASFEVVYSKYVNSLVNKVVSETLLPFPEIKADADEAPEFDMAPEKVYEALLSGYLTSLLSEKIAESRLSEASSRRKAMETANENADELLEELSIEYNKARQNAITQEIVEVVAGSGN